MKNYGFIPDVITPDQYTLLGGQLPLEELQPDGQWDGYMPEFEQQFINFETSNCTGFGLANCIEAIMLRKFGTPVNYSDRAIGILAGTSIRGNSPHVVVEAVRKNGLIPEFRLPFAEVSNVDEYYSPNPLPENLLNIGRDWLGHYSLGHDWLWSGSEFVNLSVERKVKLMKAALRSSPIGVSVYAWAEQNGVYYKAGTENHWCVCYGWTDQGWKIFDTYDNGHKIYSFDSDITFAKRYTVTKVELVAGKKVGLLSHIISLIKKLFGYE